MRANVRARFDGEKRNPWDEAECGHHYARAMSSWSAILALSGFLSMARIKPSRLHRPRLPMTSCPFGRQARVGQLLSQKRDGSTKLVLHVLGGELRCRSCEFIAPGTSATVSAGGRSIQSQTTRQQDRAIVQWAEAVRLGEGKEFQIEVGAHRSAQAWLLTTRDAAKRCPRGAVGDCSGRVSGGRQDHAFAGGGEGVGTARAARRGCSERSGRRTRGYRICGVERDAERRSHRRLFLLPVLRSAQRDRNARTRTGCNLCRTGWKLHGYFRNDSSSPAGARIVRLAPYTVLVDPIRAEGTAPTRCRPAPRFIFVNNRRRPTWFVSRNRTSIEVPQTGTSRTTDQRENWTGSRGLDGRSPFGKIEWKRNSRHRL